MFKFNLFFVVFVISVFSVHAKDSNSFASNKNLGYKNSTLVGINYARQFPIGIIKNRFGDNNSVGFSLVHKFSRNFQIQGAVNLIFGSTVNEFNMFDTMIGSSGYLIDINGNFSEVKLYERGYNWHFDFGKIFPISKFDKNSGVLVTFGAGFMQHNIKYTFQRTVLPQLEGEYAKGYDRLTNGLMLRGFMGYQRIAKDKMLNFVAGVEFLNGFTKSRRSYDFDTRRHDAQARVDNFLGLKIGIMINLGSRFTGKKQEQEDRFFE